MPEFELGKKTASLAKGLTARLLGLSLFAWAAVFALTGHLLFASLLNALKSSGVDFEKIDPAHNLVPAAQILLFALQTGLIVYALVKAGLDMKRTLAAVAALIFAVSMLMLTFVSAQCDLYGLCL
ncbi:MAG: hypothetical protein AAB227_07210 [Pseudomonadota bacterium]